MTGVVGAEETGKYQIQRQMQEEMGIEKLGRRQVMLRWVNDPVWRHDGKNGK